MSKSQKKIDEILRSLWLAGILSWKLHDAQLVIASGIASLPVAVKEAVMLCCRRFGKSFYGCVHGLEDGIQATTKRVIRIIGPDIKQTQMIVEYNMAKITEELHRLNLKKLVEPVRSEKMYKVGKKAGLFLGGFDSQADSLRGGEAHTVLIEESGSSRPDQYDYQMRSVIKPQLLKTRGRMIHLTTLPPLPDHPFILDTIPEAQKNGAFYSYTIHEDPLATPEIIQDAISDCGGEHTETYKREYLNQITRDPNIIIIPDFDEARHVADLKIPMHCFMEIVMDWGGVRDFTVSQLMTYDYLLGKDLFLDELWWTHNTPTEQIVNEIRDRWLNKYEISQIYADAPGQLQVDLNRSHNLSVKLPQKDNWEAAVNNMANRFRTDSILIDRKCELTIATCRSGIFNERRTDFERTKALGHMDAVASLMYGVRSLNRTDPYPKREINPEWQWKPPVPEEQNVILSPKSFTPKNMRKFG